MSLFSVLIGISLELLKCCMNELEMISTEKDMVEAHRTCGLCP